MELGLRHGKTFKIMFVDRDKNMFANSTSQAKAFR